MSMISTPGMIPSAVSQSDRTDVTSAVDTVTFHLRW